MTEFSLRSVKKIIEGETDFQVAPDSAKELGEELEDFAEDIVKEAIENAEQDDRVTVRQKDIREAIGYK